MSHPTLLQRFLRGVWYGVVPFHIILSGTILLHDRVVEVTPVTGSSMAPTLSPQYRATGAQDHVLWRKWAAARDLRRGDVVFFSLPHRPDCEGVKRVVALEGDTVLLDPRRGPRDGENGRRRNGPAGGGDLWEGGQARVTVPPGHVWVEGDNWRESRDSNSYGPVSKALIRGRAVALVRPVAELGRRPWEGFVVRTGVVEAGARSAGGARDDEVEKEEEAWWAPR